MPPTKTMNPLALNFPIKLLPRIAACDGPKAGNVETSPPEKTLADIVLKIVFSSTSREVIICFGIFVFEFKLSTNDDIPNNPENNGKRGSVKLGKFNVMIPRIPDKKKTNIA